MTNWTECESHLRAAIMASKAHAKLTQWAMAQYGDHGPQISGCMRTHFPEQIKDRLRRLARLVAIRNDRAMQAKPKRCHVASVRKRARAMVRELGTGFYGYIG
jgi:hypothetical protein